MKLIPLALIALAAPVALAQSFPSVVNTAEIEIECQGTLEVIEVGPSQHVWEEIPSRVSPPPKVKVSRAAAVAVVKQSSEDCEILSSKYEVDFTAVDTIRLDLKKDGWVDMTDVFQGTAHDFEWRHYISYADANGDLPLMPHFSAEAFVLDVKSRGVGVEGYDRVTVNTQDLYGSLPIKTLAEKELALAKLEELMKAAPEWQEAAKAAPWVHLTSRVEPSNIYDPKVSYDSPRMKQALATYAAHLSHLLSRFDLAILLADHPAQQLVSLYGRLLAFELTAWGGSDDPDIKVKTIEALPMLLHSDLNGTLVHLTSSMTLAEWRAFLDFAAQTIAAGGDKSEDMAKIVESLGKTRYVGIPGWVYDRIGEIIGW